MSAMTSIRWTMNEEPSMPERPDGMSRLRGLDSPGSDRHDGAVSDSVPQGPRRSQQSPRPTGRDEALMRALYAEHADALIAFVCS